MMDEQKQRILDTYRDFQHFGLFNDEEEAVDPESARVLLEDRVKDFEMDVDVAYKNNKSRRTTLMTRHAILSLMAEGGSDEDIRLYVIDNGLSTRQSAEYRREEAIKSIKAVHMKAEKAREVTNRESELVLEGTDYRSLDDTLSLILQRNGMSEQDQGSMRLLFGFAVLREGQASLDVVMRLKSNAAGNLSRKIAAAEKNLSDSPRAKEGERILYRIVNRTREGYLTVQSIAETIAHDKEIQTKAIYTDDIERNQLMIETYLSDALDAMYPATQS